MKAKELKDKSVEQLKDELKAQSRHFFDLRSQAVTEKLENPMQLRAARRTVARIKTILRQKETAGA